MSLLPLHWINWTTCGAIWYHNLSNRTAQLIGQCVMSTHTLLCREKCRAPYWWRMGSNSIKLTVQIWERSQLDFNQRCVVNQYWNYSINIYELDSISVGRLNKASGRFVWEPQGSSHESTFPIWLIEQSRWAGSLLSHDFLPESSSIQSLTVSP